MLPTCLVMLTATVVHSPARAQDTYGGGFDRPIEQLLPRVVKLYGVGAGKQAGYGSGVIVSEDGLVLTVYSLLINARQLKVVDSLGAAYGADVVFRDRDRQLALLKIKPLAGDDRPHAAHAEPRDKPRDEPLSFPYFDLACGRVRGGREFLDELLLPGDWIVAAGNAFKVADGAEPVSLAHGVFSARTRLDATRRIKNYPYTGDVLVFDAVTSNPGAPGSAVVNLEGAFVGMVGRQVISNLTRTHFNYAMPRDVLCEFLLVATGERDPASGDIASGAAPFDSGIRLAKAGYRTVLPFVERVRRRSPAARAGVRKDDLILSVNERNVQSVEECHERLSTAAGDEPIRLVIRRGREILTVQIEPEVP